MAPAMSRHLNYCSTLREVRLQLGSASLLCAFVKGLALSDKVCMIGSAPTAVSESDCSFQMLVPYHGDHVELSKPVCARQDTVHSYRNLGRL
jgi:hypothetical protein